MIQITGYLEKHGKMFLAWTENFKGVAAQGKTEDEVIQKLILLIRIKIAFDYNLELSELQSIDVSELESNKRFERKANNKFQLQI